MSSTRNNVTLNRIQVDWVTQNTFVPGRLSLIEGFLVFRKGYLAAVSWEMPLTDISNITLQGTSILIHASNYVAAEFRVDTIEASHFDFVNDIRQWITRGQPNDQSQSQVTAQDPLPSSSTSTIDDLDQAILDVITAYRNDPEIEFDKIFELVNEEHETTLDRVQLRLAKLIRLRYLPGYLDDIGYRRDTFVTIRCQVCDEERQNPNVFWQCPRCNRHVCQSCHATTQECPAHPRIPSTLVKLPLRCTNCNDPILDLKSIADYRCPNCNTPFPPP